MICDTRKGLLSLHLIEMEVAVIFAFDRNGGCRAVKKHITRI